MKSILLIAGSPTPTSRSGALLDHLDTVFDASGDRVATLLVSALPPQALFAADTSNPAIADAQHQVLAADAIVIATPIYKAAYSGILKTFLDLLPQTAFAGKIVLPLATGGSPHHMLAIDYALRPVLHALGAQHVLPAVYALDAQFSKREGGYSVAHEVVTRLDHAVEAIQRSIRSPRLPLSERPRASSRAPVAAAA